MAMTVPGYCWRCCSSQSIDSAVEVVGGLVEQQHVGLLQKQAAERHAASLASGKCGYGLVVGRTLQCVHSALELGVDVPGVGGVEFVLKLGLTVHERLHLVGILEDLGVAELLVDLVELGKEVEHGLHPFANHFDDGFLRVELRILLKVPHGIAGREHHFALETLVDSGNDFQKRGLTGAVETDNADFCAVEK